MPAIYYFRSGSKDTPEAYEGVKDAESLEAFVDEMVRKAFTPLRFDHRKASKLLVVWRRCRVLPPPPPPPLPDTHCASPLTFLVRHLTYFCCFGAVLSQTR